MSKNRGNLKTIQRTLLPNLHNNHIEAFNNTDIRYFYKIKRNLKLEDWQHQKDSNSSARHKNRDKYNNSISPRLTMLSKPKEIIDRSHEPSQMATKRPSFLNNYRRKEQTINEHFFNQNHFFFVKQDGFEFTQQENLGKDINGTALGVFSEQTITQRLQNSRTKNENRQPIGILMTRQIDSDNDLAEQKQLQMKRQSKRTRKLSLLSRNSSITSTNKVENRLFDRIYGDEEFLQKYKLQQMALMQKNSVYKQKKLTLDYKNEWRI